MQEVKFSGQCYIIGDVIYGLTRVIQTPLALLDNSKLKEEIWRAYNTKESPESNAIYYVYFTGSIIYDISQTIEDGVVRYDETAGILLQDFYVDGIKRL